jgi:hypothetical protein
MKKIYLVLMIVGMTFFSVSAQAIGISLKIDFGKRNAEGNCGPGRGICSITLGATLRAAQGENFQVVEADAELKGDKLFIKLPKGINEKGINEKGVYSVNIQKNQPVDQDVAKKLGTTELSIVPGSYEVKNNLLVLSVKAPRDAASGMATGKRQH